MTYIRRFGVRAKSRRSSSGSIRLTSALFAASMSSDRGMPRRLSTKTISLVPLPFRVLPTEAPHFLPGQTCHRRSLALSQCRGTRRAGPGAVSTPRRTVPTRSNRLQQVAGLGYRSGKSCHLAPVRRTHSTPSRRGRGGTRGRPPALVRSDSGKRSAISFHWKSSRTVCGAVLNPVVFGRRCVGHEDRDNCMRSSPFGGPRMHFACQTNSALDF